MFVFIKIIIRVIIRLVWYYTQLNLPPTSHNPAKTYFGTAPVKSNNVLTERKLTRNKKSHQFKPLLVRLLNGNCSTKVIKRGNQKGITSLARHWRKCLVAARVGCKKRNEKCTCTTPPSHHQNQPSRTRNTPFWLLQRDFAPQCLTHSLTPW